MILLAPSLLFNHFKGLFVRSQVIHHNSSYASPSALNIVPDLAASSTPNSDAVFCLHVFISSFSSLFYHLLQSKFGFVTLNACKSNFSSLVIICFSAVVIIASTLRLRAIILPQTVQRVVFEHFLSTNVSASLFISILLLTRCYFRRYKYISLYKHLST